MVTGDQKAQWVHTTSIVLAICNSHRDPKEPAIQFDDIYPFSEKQNGGAVYDMDALEAAFVGRFGKAGGQ
jgi:hypothetical protein